MPRAFGTRTASTLRPGAGPIIGDVGWEIGGARPRHRAGPDSDGPATRASARSGYRDLAGCAPQYANEGTPRPPTPPNLAYAHSLYPDYSAAIIGGPQYPASGGPYPSDYAGDIFYGIHAWLHQAGGRERRRPGDGASRISPRAARPGSTSSSGPTATSTSRITATGTPAPGRSRRSSTRRPTAIRSPAHRPPRRRAASRSTSSSPAPARPTPTTTRLPMTGTSATGRPTRRP